MRYSTIAFLRAVQILHRSGGLHGRPLHVGNDACFDVVPEAFQFLWGHGKARSESLLHDVERVDIRIAHLDDGFDELVRVVRKLHFIILKPNPEVADLH